MSEMTCITCSRGQTTQAEADIRNVVTSSYEMMFCQTVLVGFCSNVNSLHTLIVHIS